MDSFARVDPGYPCDLLVLDNSSTDARQLRLLEKYAKSYRVETKPNFGRAQGGYDYAWQNNKDYKYYFFLHDDSAFIRDNWLKKAVDRMNDKSIEASGMPRNSDTYSFFTYSNWDIGKVGFQGYEWGNKQHYLRTGYKQIFHYMEPLAEIMGFGIPQFHQHLNDDRYLIRNELLQEMGHIWNVETWKEMESAGDDEWKRIDEWFVKNGLENKAEFLPSRYGYKYNAFQTMTEFLSDMAPMRYQYRTHCVTGDGHCQEELGWSKFWGNEYIVHYGDHVVFKRLSQLLRAHEDDVRKRFSDKNFLNIVDSIIKKDTPV